MSIFVKELQCRMYYYHKNIFLNIFVLDFAWVLSSAQFALNLLTLISHAIESVMFRMVNKTRR